MGEPSPDRDSDDVEAGPWLRQSVLEGPTSLLDVIDGPGDFLNRVGIRISGSGHVRRTPTVGGGMRMQLVAVAGVGHDRAGRRAALETGADLLERDLRLGGEGEVLGHADALMPPCILRPRFEQVEPCCVRPYP